MTEKTEKAKRAPRRGNVEPALVAYLQEHQGEELALPKIVREIEALIPYEVRPATVQSVMARLVSNSAKYKVTVIVRGNIWRFEGFAESYAAEVAATQRAEAATGASGPKVGDVWEIVGKSKAGQVILRDDNGQLYTAEEM